MKTRLVLLSILLTSAGCDPHDRVVADETRPLTLREKKMTLDADNDERFRQGRASSAATVKLPPAPVRPTFVPKSWEPQSPSRFRLINYTFGSAGQAYVSTSRGGVLENANRWLRQFGKAPLDAAGLAKLEPLGAAGFDGVWVSVDGDFAGGMGQAPQTDWALRGLVAEKGGEILTIKMLGPEAEVRAEENNLRRFIGGLKPQS